MTYGDWIAAWTFLLVAALAIVAWGYREGSPIGLVGVVVVPVALLYIGENVARYTERHR